MVLGPPPAPRPRPALPVFPPPEPDGGFPVVASLAPVLVAAAVFAITRSPYALLFALAAPLAALGALLDRRIRRRRSDRRMLEAARQGVARLREQIDRAHDEDREGRARLAIDPAALPTAPLAGIWRGGEPRLRLGCADLPSPIDLGEADDAPAALRAELDDLVRLAGTVAGAPIVVAAGPVGVVGPDPMRSAVVRGLALQLCAAIPPDAGEVRAPASESWARELPHPVRLDPGARGFELTTGSTVHRVVGVARDADLPPGLPIVLRVADGTGAAVSVDGADLPADRIGLGMVAAGTAELAARRLRGSAPSPERGTALPDRVALAALPTNAAPRPGGLAAPIGIDGAGAVWVDLVRDGPHAVIGGTTGSGKSELLIAWILSLARRHRPDEAAFLLIDFKGGSSFTALAGLPHVVGVVSDLDASTARRAVTSLRSEVLRREGLLAEAGVRDLEALPGTPRLVVVVDEYAALVAEQPELHELVADLAARGRSLGIHLILCTQRPGGAIREQVLANAGLRICLRVNNRADSIAVIGGDAASALGGAPAGRALLLDADGRPRALQCAIAEDAAADTAGIAARSQGGPPPFRPWAEPLPTLITAGELAPIRDGAGFGLVDLPEQQCTAVAGYAPHRDGNLLVVGGRGAGTTEALATIAAGLAPRAVMVPRGEADAWSVLVHELDEGEPGDGRVVVVDDVDLLLDSADEDHRPGLVRLLAGLARELPVRGGALVLGASRLPSAASPLVCRVDSRLLLALPDREQHVLAGGEARDWVPRLPPGRGRWHGRDVQVALAGEHPEPVRPLVPEHVLDPGRPPAVVAAHPDAVARRLEDRGFAVAAPAGPLPPGTAIVGDPDEWAAAWGVLDTCRRVTDVLLVGCTPADLRTLVRSRADPPPLDPRRAEGWRLVARRVERVRLPWLGSDGALRPDGALRSDDALGAD